MSNVNLFTPIKIRGMELKNRIVVSPMQQFSAVNGKVGQWHLVHLGSRAVGGAGLIITESLAVNKQGRSTHFDAGLWNDGQIAGWKRINAFIHDQHAKVAAQIAHFGSKASRSHPNEGLQYLSPENGGWITKSASAVAPFGHMSLPKALSLQEIFKIKWDFVAAARRAVAAGFDAIEIHAGHGYLFHQFYSRIINQRTDNYGGSFENRIRLLVEVTEEIRSVIPENMPLLVRISAVDYLEDEKAWKIEDSVLLTDILKHIGVDVVTASAGGFVFLDKSKVFPAYQVPFAEKIKSETGIITGAVGAITEPAQANEIIASGKADLAVIAREFLRDPYFALRAAKELGQSLELPFQYRRAF
ncbi:NADH:flavin oxidoreductase/NADH oxidase [Pedobacter duraquae]|uniref:2,4-dienoyl-CoA reductase-like NADH-dependent reductase (Old Yellow Enzyme family) n=1 Tax=Pedobacter duraquae TaxID=425511 RepID=A0A4R6ILG6_9SPHI|nr:NADH:flavin oxidoreductase/NADH oxidase [Pedobacter duraquae]TDO22927.1 2,4-dienoyl-CoA reductase-like NADH-dependent reductase (Old Yellow Enzyme family) [Pedobacter duraquae]